MKHYENKEDEKKRNGLVKSINNIYIKALEKKEKFIEMEEHGKEVRARKLFLDFEDNRKKFLKWKKKEEAQKIKNNLKQKINQYLNNNFYTEYH